MNEIKKIHLGRQQFTIAIDAHKALRAYLDAIAKQPGVQPEVVEEVEMRMAELLAERGVTADKVILAADVDFLKEQLGEPRDFKDDAGEDEAAEESTGAERAESGPRRLYRDTENAWLAGVASGLGAYLGIDALIVRIAFIALTFASGFGIVLYLILWLLAPEARTPSERLQMQGKAVTVDSLKEMVERADISGAGERAGRQAEKLGRNAGRAFGRVIELIAQVILLAIGAVFVAAGVVIMLWTFATAAYMLIHGGQIGTEIVFPLGAREVWFVVLAFVTTFILGFLILMSGLTMSTRKWRLPVWSVVALLSIFFVAGGIATALGFDTVPHIEERFRQAHHTQTRQLTTFNDLSIQGEDVVVSFVPGDKYFVEISYLGDVDTKPLATKVEDGTLKIDSRGFTKTPLCTALCFYSDHDLKISVHAPKVDSVRLDGEDSTFRIEEPLRQENLKVEMTRRGDSHVNLSAIEASSAALTDGDRADRVLTVTGIKQNAGDGEIRLYTNEGIAHVDAVEKFNYQSARSCDAGEPQVFVGRRTSEISINGKMVWGEEQLNNLRSFDANNDYNCVVIR